MGECAGVRGGAVTMEGGMKGECGTWDIVVAGGVVGGGGGSVCCRCWCGVGFGYLVFLFMQNAIQPVELVCRVFLCRGDAGEVQSGSVPFRKGKVKCW